MRLRSGIILDDDAGSGMSARSGIILDDDAGEPVDTPTVGQLSARAGFSLGGPKISGGVVGVSKTSFFMAFRFLSK